MAVSLQARVVFTVDGPPIEHGVVTIEAGRIVAVGKKTRGQAVRDLGDVALMPGFVNTHTHLEFSHLRQPLGEAGMRLPDWIRLVIAERGRGDTTAADTVAAGIEESVAAGVTTLGEIATAPFESYTSSDVHLTLLSEVIGFSRARAASAFAAAKERFAAVVTNPRLRQGVSPHAPYTVSPTLLERLIGLARQRDMPVAMHLAESPEELQFLAEGRGPFQELLEERSMWDADAIPLNSCPRDYLRMLSAAPRALVIHGNYLADDEREFLAAQSDHMSLVYCPRTHAYFQHSPYPLDELLATGVRVVLGTDSRASNPELSLFAEMRHVAKAHPSIAPAVILRMATLDGANALGWATEVGSLTPGKSADLVAVPLPPGASGAGNELLAAVLHSVEQPSGVWSHGREYESPKRG